MDVVLEQHPDNDRKFRAISRQTGEIISEGHIMVMGVPIGGQAVAMTYSLAYRPDTLHDEAEASDEK